MALLEEVLHDANVVPIRVTLPPKCDMGGFAIGALTKPDLSAFTCKPMNVRHAAV
jgi:hypothetical protein